MDANAKAHLLTAIVAIVPSIAAYLWGIYFNYFPMHSWKQYATLLATLVVAFGVIPLQRYIYLLAAGMTTGDMFSSVLTFIQYLVALVILFVVVIKRDKAKKNKVD